MERMAGAMDGGSRKPWSRPPVESRAAFLEGLQRFANVEGPTEPQEQEEDPEEEDDPVRSLINEGRLNEAFFLARRRAAEGQEGAEQLLSEISRLM